MYLIVVAAFMLVLPVGSILINGHVNNAAPTVMLVAKWFGFWSVGARLFLAGLRQVIQPRYTASVILQLKHDESLILVRELGFANLAIGLAGLGTLLYPAWIPAAVLAGAVFYLLAGFSHLTQAHRHKLENIALISDLFVGIVLALALVIILL
jgi:hypothetical protein